MNEKLRKTSNVFWWFFAVTLVCSYTACVYIGFTPEQFDQISFTSWLMLVPNLVLIPLLRNGLYEPVHIAVSYALLMIPISFAAIAIALRIIAKELRE